jgi:DNA-binding response OmpR family regulator
MRRLISHALDHSDLPVMVTTARDGPEALDLAEAAPPDFVVLDIMMPGMDGYEVCRRLRGNVRTTFVPILMLTALDDPDHRARGFVAGTDDYIGKPFSRTELVARVRRLLQRTYGASANDEEDSGLTVDGVGASDVAPAARRREQPGSTVES